MCKGFFVVEYITFYTPSICKVYTTARMIIVNLLNVFWSRTVQREFIVLNLKKIYNEKVRNFFNDITISTSWVPQSSSSKVYVLRGACSINVCDSVFLNKVRFIFIFHYFSLIFKQVFLRETLYSCFFQQFSGSPWLIRYEKLQNFLFVRTMSVSINHATETKMNPSQIY